VIAIVQSNTNQMIHPDIFDRRQNFFVYRSSAFVLWQLGASRASSSSKSHSPSLHIGVSSGSRTLEVYKVRIRDNGFSHPSFTQEECLVDVCVPEYTVVLNSSFPKEEVITPRTWKQTTTAHEKSVNDSRHKTSNQSAFLLRK